MGSPPLSLAHQRKTNKQQQEKKLSTNLILYTTHWTKLRRAENKKKKEFILEVWAMETLNKIILKKMGGGAEKYFTNEAHTRNTE